MRPFPRFAAVLTTALVLTGPAAQAGVWSEEQSGEKGEPVRFCMQGVCEETRFVLQGSTLNWAFFELANGYRSDTWTDEGFVYSHVATLNDVKLTPAELASVTLGEEMPVDPAVTVDASGKFMRLAGGISPEMLSRVRREVSRHSGLLGVSLDSGGGDPEAAVSIAGLIADLKLSTYVAEGSRCAADCSLLFLSGYDRQADGYLDVAPKGERDGPADGLRARQIAVLEQAEAGGLALALMRGMEWGQSFLAQDGQFDRDLPGDASDFWGQ